MVLHRHKLHLFERGHRLVDVPALIHEIAWTRILAMTLGPIDHTRTVIRKAIDVAAGVDDILEQLILGIAAVVQLVAHIIRHAGLKLHAKLLI